MQGLMASPAAALSWSQWPAQQACLHSTSARSTCRLQNRCKAPAAAVVEPAQLVAIAAEPVAEVALLSAAGALCAKQGLLPLQGRRLLSGLVMNVFTPALLFSKLGASVDVPEAIRLWPLAANMAACHVAGIALGWLQVRALNTPASLASQVTVMTALGNVGNLPLVLIPALLSRPGVLELITSTSTSSSGSSSGSSATPLLDVATATSMGLEYVMLGFFYASFIQFPLGYLLLQRKPEQQQQQGPQAVMPQPAAAAAAAAALGPAASAAAGSSSAALAGPPSTLQQQVQQAGAALVQPLPPSQQERSVLPQQQRQQEQLLMLARGVFTPPVLACLLAVPVASLPALRSALFDPGGDLRFLGDVSTLLGAPLIPCLFLVLGANLAEGPGAGQVPMKTVLGLLASKLFLHPLLGLAGLLAALHAGLLPSDTDPLMLLVMLLVWATPSAVLTHSLATMLQNGEDQVSFFLFYQYLASLASLPACLALYLQLLQSGLLTAAPS